MSRAWHAQLSSLKANIKNVKLVLVFLGVLEEYRDLYVLKKQKIYWKQKGTTKWVKLGDEGTRFFHANATIRKRKNLITTLTDNNGVPQSNHHIKASIIWEAFKERLGPSDSPEMLFNLEQLLHRITWILLQTLSHMRTLMQ